MIQVRNLKLDDFHMGFLETLSTLTDVGFDPETDFAKLKSLWAQRLEEHVKTYVAIEGKEVVGTATMFVEQKFIHNGGRVAHVEDVAVRESHQRIGVGSLIMDQIEKDAIGEGCYKIILDCGRHNEAFYSKLGYHRHESQMRKDL